MPTLKVTIGIRDNNWIRRITIIKSVERRRINNEEIPKKINWN